MRVEFNGRGLVVTAIGAAVLWLALRTHTIPLLDVGLRIVIVTIVVSLSVGMILGMVRRRQLVPLATDGAFRELTRLFKRVFPYDVW